MTVYSDLDKQNAILVENKMKKIKKVERKLVFSDIAVCRDFVFHLKRLYHFHNCRGIEN